MIVRGVDARDLVRAAMTFMRRRAIRRPRYFQHLISEPPGRSELTSYERRLSLVVDAMLRRAGVGCLWRAAVVTETLRRRGIAAHIRLSVATTDPTQAHAESEVGGLALLPHPAGHVLLRAP